MIGGTPADRARAAKNLRRFRAMTATIPEGGHIVAVLDKDGTAGFWLFAPHAAMRGEPPLMGAVFDDPALVKEALQYLDHLARSGRLIRGGLRWHRRDCVTGAEAARFTSALKEYLSGKLHKYLIGRVL